MSSHKLVLGFLLLLVAGLVAAPAWADSQVRIVRLSVVDGPVQIDRNTGQGFEKAIVNMPITQGMKVRTGDGARAEVEFEDGTNVRLAGSSEAAFPQLSLRPDGVRASTMRIDGGTVYVRFSHKKKDDFHVAFAGQELILNHGVHFRLEVNKDDAQLAIFDGELALPEQVNLKKNETATLDLRTATKYEIAKGISPEPNDGWDSDREKYHDYYASNAYSGSPYYYGRSDLNYYGSWAYMPGYGMLWRPYGVGYGWDPFSTGAWSWYPGWGYTWVSSYPWGWTPYRYGSWVYLNPFGWCWQPGTWNYWNQGAIVYNAPPTYVPPQPPPTKIVAGPTTGGTGAPTGGIPTTIIVDRRGRIGLGPKGRPVDDEGGTSAVTPTGSTARVSTGTGTAPATTSTTSSTTSSVSTMPRASRSTVPGPNGPVARQERMNVESGAASMWRGRAGDTGVARGAYGGARPVWQGGTAAPARSPAVQHSAPAPPRVSSPPPAAPRMSSPQPAAPRPSPPPPSSSKGRVQ